MRNLHGSPCETSSLPTKSIQEGRIERARTLTRRLGELVRLPAGAEIEIGWVGDCDWGTGGRGADYMNGTDFLVYVTDCAQQPNRLRTRRGHRARRQTPEQSRLQASCVMGF